MNKQPDTSKTPQRRRLWLPLLIMALILVTLLAAAFIAVSTHPTAEIGVLPTLAVLPTLMDTPVTLTFAPDTPTEDSAAVSVPPVQPSEVVPLNTAETADINTAPTSTPDIQNPIVIGQISPTGIIVQPGNPLPLPTRSDNTNLATATISETSAVTLTMISETPTITSTPAPTNTPIPTPVFDEVAAIDTPLNLPIGQFRVVDAARGAESTITDLGGTFPPAPSGQSWLLLELLLLCSDGVPCAYTPSSLTVIGSTGTLYSYSSQLNLIPQFGSSLQNNQLWGYLGFTIPTSETQLRLVLTANGKTYAISLP